jgi:phosphoserine phosphatase RsbU/P
MKNIDQIEQLNNKIKDLTSVIDVTSIISSTLDLDELMNLVMEKAQEVMHAEASSILLLNEETGMLECEIATGSVHEKVKKIQLKLGQGIAGWVAQQGEPLIVADVQSDTRFFQSVDQSTGFETRSILASPLKVKNKVIGVAEVINRRDALPFTNENLEIFVTFCRQVALAIENARMHKYMLAQQRMKQQLQSAHRIQQSFMPQFFPESDKDRYLIYAKNIPATAVGGDLFDFVQIDSNRVGIVIGDVSGKGIPAALYMARLISDFRYYCHIAEKPVELVHTLNEALLKRSHQGMFISLIFMVLDTETGKLIISNAGHLPPIWYQHQSNSCQLIDRFSGIPLGILEEAEYDEYEVQLEPGDMVLLYTDGVTEAKNNKSEMFSLNRLNKLLDYPRNHPKVLIDEIVEEIKIFTGSVQQHDDITLLAVRWQ